MSDRGFRRTVEKMLKRDGWVRDRFNCVHEILTHPTKEGSIPLPYRLNDRRLALDILKKQAKIPGARL